MLKTKKEIFKNRDRKIKMIRNKPKVFGFSKKKTKE